MASCGTPSRLEDVSKFPNLTRALLEKGYSEEDIRKTHGGNLPRRDAGDGSGAQPVTFGSGRVIADPKAASPRRRSEPPTRRMRPWDLAIATRPR